MDTTKGVIGIAIALVAGIAVGFFGPTLVKGLKDSKKITPEPEVEPVKAGAPQVSL